MRGFIDSTGYWQTITDVSDEWIANLPEGTIEVPLRPNEYHTWDADNSVWVDGYVAPTAEELRQQMKALTARQFRLGLLGGGITLTQVDSAIAAISDPTERATAEIEWNFATQFERLHPLVVSLSASLGLTPEQVDTMWTGALEL